MVAEFKPYLPVDSRGGSHVRHRSILTVIQTVFTISQVSYGVWVSPAFPTLFGNARVGLGWEIRLTAAEFPQ